MTRAERRRLLDTERKLAFGEALSALFAQWGYKRSARYVCIKPVEDGDEPMRFVIDDDGDLADRAYGGPWADEEVAIRRAAYEAKVAKGIFDKDTDTDEDVEVEKPSKAKDKLTLPLTTGQRVVLTDGSTGVVEGLVDSDGDIKIHHDDKGYSFWHSAKTGRFVGGDEDDNHAAADAPDWEPEPKPKRKPKPKTKKLTLPLTVGQKVVTRDGTVATVIENGGSIARLDGHHGTLWTDIGRRWCDGANEHPSDAMHDAD